MHFHQRPRPLFLRDRRFKVHLHDPTLFPFVLIIYAVLLSRSTAPVSDANDEPSHWACSRCTSINHPDLPFCEFCESRSTTSPGLSSLSFSASHVLSSLTVQRLFSTQTMNHHTGPALDARLSTTLTSLSANSARLSPASGMIHPVVYVAE